MRSQSTSLLSTRRRRSNRGLAIVEFAITMPLVLLLLAATADLGRALYQYTALNKAVQDGARYLSEKGYLVANAVLVEQGDRDAAIEVTKYGTPNGPKTPVLPGFENDVVTADVVPGTQFVRVQAVYDFQPMFVAFAFLGSEDTVTFTATATQKSLR
jgi:Flp pilus assembly protein TadG